MLQWARSAQFIRRLDRDNFGTFQRRRAQSIALSAYLWSVFIVVVAVPLLIVDVTLIESFVRRLPQNESANNIGAWKPYASTGLVLFAAALAKSYETTKALLLQLGGNVRKVWRKIFPSKTKSSKLKHDKYVDALRKVKNAFKAIGSFVFGLNVRGRAKQEWKSFAVFCMDPEQSYKDYLESRRPQILSTCPRDYECQKHKECVHRLVCTDQKQCRDCKACNDDPEYDALANHGCKGHKDHIIESSVAASEGLVPAMDIRKLISTTCPGATTGSSITAGSSTINMLPHDSDAKYRRKRNPEGQEQAGSKEKE
ncbi:hypothetical protein V493_00638 [Pseudogymnoascus sp. VKM F-4281 (FW-2241)]|nr:hypothetical protein V493_00638 [Pseudogymnoascus sp. VKM F-4281 (FW-2241)]